MKTMNTLLVAVVVNFLAAGVSLAQNNDAPAPLSSQNGKQYTIGGKPQTIESTSPIPPCFRIPGGIWEVLAYITAVPG